MKTKRKFVKINPEVRWLLPFLRVAKPLLLINRLKSVKGFKPPITKAMDAEGTIIKLTTGKHKIGIRTHDHVYDIISKPGKPVILKFRQRTKRPLFNILSSAAHEISHLIHWEHTIEHFKLEQKLMLKFCKVLEQQKVKNLYNIGYDNYKDCR